jgi:Mg-chelatase subunit ChlI
MQVEFPTSNPSGVMAVVRNHKDDCFGVEFLKQLPSRDKTLNKSNQTCDPKTLFAGLRRKKLEIMQVQREIEALNLAIPLLADDKRESAEPALPQRSELDRRPWPSLGPKPAQQRPLSL